MTLLTADDVLNKKFQTTKFREGYDQDEVDDFLDEIVNTLRVTQGENEELKAKVAAAEQQVAELSGGAAAAETTGPLPAVVDAPEPEAELEPTPEPESTPEPEPEAESAPVYAAPSYTPPAGGSEPESATGMLQLAQRLHDEYVRNGKEESDRIVSAAREEATRITGEAEEQRSRTLTQLETEQATLEHKISQLRTFERDYRMRLKSFLGSLVETLDAQSSVVGLDGPPPQL